MSMIHSHLIESFQESWCGMKLLLYWWNTCSLRSRWSHLWLTFNYVEIRRLVRIWSVVHRFFFKFNLNCIIKISGYSFFLQPFLHFNLFFNNRWLWLLLFPWFIFCFHLFKHFVKTLSSFCQYILLKWL